MILTSILLSSLKVGSKVEATIQNFAAGLILAAGTCVLKRVFRLLLTYIAGAIIALSLISAY